MTKTATSIPDAPEIAAQHLQEWVVDVERPFQERVPGTFFVWPRVVRRVLQNELEIASPWLPPPHRKSCVIERDKLLWLVARDELGLEADAVLPQRLILIARPEEDRLTAFSRASLQRYYWRLLFHARIDFEVEPRVSALRMPIAVLRSRIDRIGQSQFDEIRSVLRAENMLLRPDDVRNVYAEFVAVYHELRKFAPDLLPLYFPSLDDPTAVMEVIATECDAESLFESTRPASLSSVPAVEVPAPLPAPEVALLDSTSVPNAKRSSRKHATLMTVADRLRTKGNNIRAALTRMSALSVATPEAVDVTRRELITEVELLVKRLQTALELSDEAARPWLAMLERLLPEANQGFWNANARLLYDLQQVCLDHEQEMYRVDLLRWALSAGKQSLKRPLPNHRVVLMSKHLRNASLRVSTVRIDDAGRHELGELLHAAAAAAEQILRKRLAPLVETSLGESGLAAQDAVERVSFRKLTHELLDGIVKRGFLTLGDLRDGVSRNQVKMPDLQNIREWLTGDPLLRADGLLGSRLDGVYQRGPFYLRWLQRANSLAFGLPIGRMLTKYIALPFGLAFLTLMALEELAHLGSKLLPSPSEQKVAAQIVEIPEQRLTGNGETDKREPQTRIIDWLPRLAGFALADEPASSTKADAPTKDDPPNEVVPKGDDPDKNPSPPDEPTNSEPRPVEAGNVVNDPHDLNPKTPEDAHGHTGPSHAAHSSKKLVYSHFNLLWLGCFLFALLHFPRFRDSVFTALRTTWKLLKVLLIDFPQRVFNWPVVAWVLKSFPMMLFRRFLLLPLISTGVFWFLLPAMNVYNKPNQWIGLGIFAASMLILNSRVGRDTEELSREFLGRVWYRIRKHLLLGLFTLIVDTFQWLMDALERVLYAVDEFLRFRSGESTVMLGVKAVVGLVWSVVHGVIRFCVTLLIEPQINPIKHFPVVTVSHKLILPWTVHITYLLAAPLTPFVGTVIANAVGPLVVTAIPGVFGFLVWELKENWKLYRANRQRQLATARIGHHGESLLRLLRPGFHSGTIPKLFARRRRAARKAKSNPRVDRQAHYTEKLHHEAEAIRHFAERELVGLLKESRTFRDRHLSIGHVDLATNRVMLSLEDEKHPHDPVRIEFAEQAGWLIASVAQAGWLDELIEEDLAVFRAALAGFYKVGGVELVREQIEDRLAIQTGTWPVESEQESLRTPQDSSTEQAPPSSQTLERIAHSHGRHRYDIANAGLVVWPHGQYDMEVTFNLEEPPTAIPRPRSVAKAAGLSPHPLSELSFDQHEVDWDDWQAYWETEHDVAAIPRRLLHDVTLLKRV